MIDMELINFFQPVLIGVFSAGLTLWADRRVTAYRLKRIERDVEDLKEDVSTLQQTTARLAGHSH